MNQRVNRRQFLQAGAAGVAATALGGYVAYAAEQKTHRVGLIGCGWYGKNDLFRLMEVAPVEVVSLCDVDQQHLSQAADLVADRQSSGKKPRMYGDYREMLKEKDLDIVLVGTPDHWHALNMIAAVESGADVYCQKPISRDVLEGDAMVRAARKNNRVVQIGTQRRSTPHLIEAKKRIVDSGMLGKIGHVNLCCYYHMRANGNPPVQPVPEYFNYDLWTGPAPLRPYDGIPHVRWWRTFMEYGNGIVGDMCVHMFDAVRWMLDLGWPTRVSSTGGIRVQKDGKSNISDTQQAVYEYPDFDIVWQHRTWGTAPDPDYPWALFIHGENGTLKASPERYDFVPAEGSKEKPLHADRVPDEKEKYPKEANEPDIDLSAAPANRQHQRNFLEAVASRGKPVADVEQGYISTASCILANLSMALGGRPLTYDPAKREVVNDAEATRLLQREYRAPWKHPTAE